MGYSLGVIIENIIFISGGVEVWPRGKAVDFDSAMRWLESIYLNGGRWAVSSAVERLTYIEVVSGSNPLLLTVNCCHLLLWGEAGVAC